MTAETQQSTPPPATPEPEMNWIFAAIARRWPAVKNFLGHLACFVAGALLITFLYDKFIIPGKDSTIQALQTRLENPNGPAFIYDYEVWAGPTNTLFVTNQIRQYFYQASGNCAITNISNPSSVAVADASLTVYNTSSKTIILYVTDSSVRPIGSATNALEIGPGKIGFLSVQCFGQKLSEYADIQQQ